MMFINCNRGRSQPRSGLHFHCARHTQRQIHRQSLTSDQEAQTKPGEEKVTEGGSYQGTTLTGLYFQVPLSLVSFLDSSGFVTIAKPNKAPQQSIIFKFALQNIFSDLLSGC